MKLDGLDHPKTLDFAARLDISLPQAIGHLELLWAFVAQKTPHGNVGKWADGAIARASHWTGEPTAFVTALCEAGFIEEHDEFRLIVHDWHEHAPRWVASKLSRAGQDFCRPAGCETPDEDGKEDSSEDDTGDSSGDYSPDSSAESKPSLAKSSQTKSGQGKLPGSGEPKDEYPPEFEQLWADYPPRAGGSPKKSAFKAWKARIKAGADPQAIADGVARYARFCAVTGKLGTEYVKQASTFFGPDEHYLNDWTPPPPKAVGSGRPPETPRERAIRMAGERGIPHDPK